MAGISRRRLSVIAASPGSKQRLGELSPYSVYRPFECAVVSIDAGHTNHSEGVLCRGGLQRRPWQRVPRHSRVKLPFAAETARPPLRGSPPFASTVQLSAPLWRAGSSPPAIAPATRRIK